MPTEVVLDANVLGHCSNTTDRFHEASVDYVSYLVGSNEVLLFDDTSGGTSFSGSHLANEYTPWVSTPGLAQSFFDLILSSGRFKFYEKPPLPTRRVCARLVPRNKRDQIFLGLATCSPDRYLVSNDYDDFDVAARVAAKRELKVTVEDASEA